MRVALMARRPFTFENRALKAGDVFDASPIDTVILRQRGVARWAPKGAVPTDQRQPPMTRCRFCGEGADDCGGLCSGARAARNAPADHKSRTALDTQQAADAHPAASVDDSPAGTTCPAGPLGMEGLPTHVAKPKRTYSRRDLTAEGS